MIIIKMISVSSYIGACGVLLSSVLAHIAIPVFGYSFTPVETSEVHVSDVRFLRTQQRVEKYCTKRVSNSQGLGRQQCHQ